MKGRGCDGFTLLELLVVIAIIGTLAAIAVPMLLGQRERARVVALETTVSQVEGELRILMDDYSMGRPMLLLSAQGESGCYEQTGVSGGNSCAIAYPDSLVLGNYSSSMDIVDAFVMHHNKGMNSLSPYDGRPLLTTEDTTEARSGHILIVNTTGNFLRLTAWTLQDTVISNSPIGFSSF